MTDGVKFDEALFERTALRPARKVLVIGDDHIGAFSPTVLYGRSRWSPLLVGSIRFDTEGLVHRDLVNCPSPPIVIDLLADIAPAPQTPYRIDEAPIRAMLQVLAARRPAGLLKALVRLR